MSSIQQIKHQKQAIIRGFAASSNPRGLSQAANTLTPMVLLWWVATWSAQFSYWWVAGATVLLCLFTLRVLVLMHECGHGSLFRTRWLNRAFGFLFGAIAGMPQYVWSQHHDFHHATNGNWEKYRGALTTLSVAEYEAMTEAQQRMYRHSRSFWLAPFAGFVYLIFNPRFTWLKGSLEFVIHIVRGKITQPRERLGAHVASFKPRYWQSRAEYWHMFWNNVAVVCMWAAMSWTIGPALYFTIYVVSVSLAGGIGIALFTLQHNFENSYATDSRRWDYDMGAIEGTSFLVLPRWLNWFTANIGYHHVHHLSAKIPNYRLVECHKRYSHLFTGVIRITPSQILKSLRCILWDTRTERIVSLDDYVGKNKRAAAVD